MYKLFILIFISISIASYSQKITNNTLVTVKGKIPSKKMGITLIHEHILVDFIGADSTGYHRWNKAEVVARALPFLMKLKKYGVKTFFDCTPAYVGRDPLILKELSDKTGLNIITNTGCYGARNNIFIPASIQNSSPEEMAKVWIDEFKNGIEGTGIYPGFIKIAVDSNDVLSPMHIKLVQAAAITHKATGMTIVSHTGKDGPSFAQLQILKEEGVSPEAFVWTHAQRGTMDGYLKAAKMGAWISLDNINKNNMDKPGGIEWIIPILKQLKNENLLHKLLISHDSGWYNVGKENGGNYNGYTDIFEYLIPALKVNGFSKKDIDLLLVKNPQNAYALKIKKGNLFHN
jgi:phosphotriesterase-related protein